MIISSAVMVWGTEEWTLQNICMNQLNFDPVICVAHADLCVFMNDFFCIFLLLGMNDAFCARNLPQTSTS